MRWLCRVGPAPEAFLWCADSRLSQKAVIILPNHLPMPDFLPAPTLPDTAPNLPTLTQRLALRERPTGTPIMRQE